MMRTCPAEPPFASSRWSRPTGRRSTGSTPTASRRATRRSNARRPTGTISTDRIGTIAGSYITTGQVTRNCKFRLLRDNVVVYTGEIESVKRLKDDVREVKEGFECGIKLKNYNDIAEGDQLEIFEVKEVARTL